MTSKALPWTYYDVKLKIDRIVGGLPVRDDLILAWQEAHWRKHPPLPGDPATPEEAARLTKALVTHAADVVDDEQNSWTTFPRDEDGYLCIETRCIKAMLKESANILRKLVKADGAGNYLRARLAERVFVPGRLIPFEPRTTEPHASPERPIHVMTAMGPRDALKRADELHGVSLSVRLKVLDDGMFTVDVLSALLDHASENGLGADRSQGAGTFAFTIEAAD